MTAWSGRRGTHNLMINRGGRDGIRIGQAVVDGSHLVGRITDTDPVTSTVRLILSPDTRLGARIVPPSPKAPPRDARAYLTVSDDGDVLTGKVGADAVIRKGDLVHLADSAWPDAAQGFLIGSVVAYEKWPDDPLNYRRVVVRPPASLMHLQRAVVLVPPEDLR
ncbi:MAG: rod shape-determining protein MreC [Phycisphaeraceae bacterium]|nr:rod shape-determining protein MreC [Phycisphaeraceae bacterium]